MLNYQDIEGVLKLVVGETMPQPEIEAVREKMFKELDENDDKVISKDTFQTVLWATDFLNKMTLHF